jgi:D-alanyl-D-alanine carboxypeptidase
LWRGAVRKRVFEPLHLEDTLLPEPGDLSIPGNYAHGCVFMGREVLDVTAGDRSMAGAAGGHALVTTTTDLARFLDAVMGRELFQDLETLDEMLTFMDVPEGSFPMSEAAGYGLGMMKFALPSDIEMLGHGGDTAGFSGFVYSLPAEDITMSGMISAMEPMSVLPQIIYPTVEMLVPGFSP